MSAQQIAMAHHAALLKNPAPVGVIWDASRKGAGVVLTGSNLIAECNSGSGNGEKVFATLSRNAATAAHYFELVPSVIGQYYAIGLARTDANGTTQAPLGTNVGEIGWYNNIGYFFYDTSGGAGTGFQASGSPTPGSPVFVATDVAQLYLVSGSLYFGIVGQGWYDPGASVFRSTVGAVVTPFMTGITGSWAPANSNGFGGAQSRGAGRFAAASFTGSIPSGGAAWE